MDLNFADMLDKRIFENERIRNVVYVYADEDLKAKQWADAIYNNGYSFRYIFYSFSGLLNTQFCNGTTEMYIIFITSNKERFNDVDDLKNALCGYSGLIVIDVIYLYQNNDVSPEDIASLCSIRFVWTFNINDSNLYYFIAILGMMMGYNEEGCDCLINREAFRGYKMFCLRDFRLYNLSLAKVCSVEADKEIRHYLDSKKKECGSSFVDDMNKKCDLLESKLLEYPSNEKYLYVKLIDLPMSYEGFKQCKGKRLPIIDALELLYGKDRDLWKYIEDNAFSSTFNFISRMWADKSLADIFSDIPYWFWLEGYSIITNKYENTVKKKGLSDIGINIDEEKNRQIEIKDPAQTDITIEAKGRFEAIKELAVEKAMWTCLMEKLNDKNEIADIREKSENIRKSVDTLKRSIPKYEPDKCDFSHTEFLKRCIMEKKDNEKAKWVLIGHKDNAVGLSWDYTGNRWVSIGHEDNGDKDIHGINGINKDTIFMLSVMPSSS